MKIDLPPAEDSLVNENVRSLGMLINDLEDTISALKSFDQMEEINAHCDQMLIDVSLTVQSNIKHLLNLESDLSQQIEKYRQERVKALQSKDSTDRLVTAKSELDVLSQASINLASGFKPSFIQESQTKEKEDYQTIHENALDLKFKASLLKSKMKRLAFNQHFMDFNPNTNFIIGYDHIGKLKIRNQVPRNEGKLFNTTDFLINTLIRRY